MPEAATALGTPQSTALIRRSPTVIGLIGAIGAGKSTVAKMLGECGCDVFDADKAGHEVLQHPETVRRLRSLFGNDIVDANGKIDRKKVATLVFADQAKRRQLELVVHPAIREMFEAAQRSATGRNVDFLVLEAPVLLEAGWNNVCDTLIFVDAPRAQRIERLKSRGWDEAELAAREAAQFSNDEKRSLAQFFVTNNGSLEACRRQVNQILDQVRHTHVKGVS